MRTAIWAAVSTTAQATPDKVSITVQLQKGREFIASRGYQPAGEYIVPGESRTKYISLYHAEKEIEPLHHLLESAARNEFDLLFVYDLNRFRTLMRQVYDVLCDYNIQLFIHTNPREPVLPTHYTEEHKAAVGMIVDLANIISRNETSNLARHFREKMPGRIQRGLDARLGGIPYGYKRTHPGDKENPLVIDPPKARIVNQIKDLFLKGESYKGICKHLNQKNIPAPEGGIWYPETIRIILARPYYAGIVYFGIHKYNRDRRTGTEHITINPSPTYNKGKHKPLWDESTHLKILDIIEKRGRGYKGNKTARLSGLLNCYCGKVLHLDRSKTTGSGTPYHYWTCSSRLPAHTAISNKKALALIIPKIVEEIRNTPNLPIPVQTQDPAQDTQIALQELLKKRARWLDLYEDEKINKEALTERLQRIENQINESKALLTKQLTSKARLESSRTTRTRLAQLIDRLEGYYLTAPEPQVNADLKDMIDRITITKDHHIKIHWRGED